MAKVLNMSVSSYFQPFYCGFYFHEPIYPKMLQDVVHGPDSPLNPGSGNQATSLSGSILW
jgi:hypothetical protein